MERRGLFYLDLGALVKTARVSRGYTQQALASKVGLSRTAVTNIEAGRQGVDALMLSEIAGVLGVSVQELMPDLSRTLRPSMDDLHDRVHADHMAWVRGVLGSDT